MSAEVIDFPARIEPVSNGAREALVDIGQGCPFHVDSDVVMHWADDVLMELWARGFMVVPINAAD